MTLFSRRLALGTAILLIVIPLLAPPGLAADQVAIDYFILQTPGGRSIDQGSDLHYGALGPREGLWLVSDRNGGATAGRIFFISRKTLRECKPGRPLTADEELTIIPPLEGWDRFSRENRAAGGEVLVDVRKRLERDLAAGGQPALDLEAITIAPSPQPPHEPRLFVVTEEPYSTVLELRVEGSGAEARARLTAVYAFHENEQERGTARNDGLEGIEYAGEPGRFYLAEEGTTSAGGAVGDLLFFLNPRLSLARLRDGVVAVEEDASRELTVAVRNCRRGSSQTLNALTRLPDGRLLAVDRNGGWILRIDVCSRSAERWLNLYDLGGTNLRLLLAEVPGPRRMPYVSIEGIAAAPDGALWLIDDPAIPEPFRGSVLVRLTRPELAASRPATAVSP